MNAEAMLTEAKVRGVKRSIVRFHQHLLTALFDREWPRQPTSMRHVTVELEDIFEKFNSLYSFISLEDSAFIQDQIYKARELINSDSELQGKYNKKYAKENQN